MKADLATSIAIAVFGALIAYFCCNFFIGKLEDFSFKTIDSASSSELANPDPEVFNYKALNPTVETYVGNCSEYDAYGQCVDEDSEQIDESTINGTTKNDTQNDAPTEKDK